MTAVLGAGLAVLLVYALASCGGGRDHTPTAFTTAKHKAHPPPPTVHLTVEANGDLLIHSPIFIRAQQLSGGHGYDFRPMLSAIKPYVKKADLAICHVETPMTSAPPQGYPVFNTPPDLAKSIKATGWDLCDTASNHSLDQGQNGIDQTGQALDHSGIPHTGSFPSPQAANRITMVKVKGVKVAFLAYTEMTNGIPLPHPWSVNLAKAPKIEADARRARRLGAQVVLVNLHWGDENVHPPSTFQSRLAPLLTADPDITAVIGQHVHVVQPIRWIHGKPVVFGEGNLLSNQTAACCPAESEDGLMAQLFITVRGKRARVDRVSYVPVWVRQPDFLVVPIGAGLRRGLVDAATLRQSYQRTVGYAGRGPRTTPVPAHLP